MPETLRRSLGVARRRVRPGLKRSICCTLKLEVTWGPKARLRWAATAGASLMHPWRGGEAEVGDGDRGCSCGEFDEFGIDFQLIFFGFGIDLGWIWDGCSVGLGWILHGLS